MTLRLTLWRDLRFGRLVDLDPALRGVLDAELCAVTLSRDFAFIGSLAIMITRLRVTLDPRLCVVTLSRDFALYRSTLIIALFEFKYKPTNVLIMKLLLQRLERDLNGHAPFEARVNIACLNTDGVNHIAALHKC